LQSFKKGLLFGLGFWTAGVIILCVPFAAILFGLWQAVLRF